MTFEQVKEIVLVFLAPLSALGGVWLASHLQSRDRNKNFIANEIMIKKLDCYEQLFDLMRVVEEAASRLFEQSKLAKTSKDLNIIEDEVFPAGLLLAKFTDDNRLYLDENVVIHIVASALGPSSVYDLKPQAKNYLSKIKEIESKFREDYNIGVELIEDYVGIKRLRKSFTKINKPKTTSPIVEYADELRKKYKHKK